MKKTATLLFILMASASLLRAQKFEISITSITVANKGTIDSVHLGDKVILNITFQNNGAFPMVSGNYQPDSFPGGKFYFNYNVSPDGNKNKIDTTTILDIPGIAYKGYATIQDTVYINKDFFQAYLSDTLNIIIIWPTGSGIANNKTDSLDPNPSRNYDFYVYPHTAGINAPNTQSQFSMFPNPAKDGLNITIKESGNGMIRLMDMAGKTIISKPYTSRAGETINFPLHEGAGVPDGLYLVSLQTASGSQVEKVMICK